MATTAATDQDFLAAVDEIESNTAVRRLMFVLINLLVPGLFLAATDCLTGSSYPAELAWLPEHMLSILGGILAISGALIGAVLVRCHFGMVVNGNKIRRVTTGELGPRQLNWSGVSTNFVALTCLSSVFGIALLALRHAWGWIGLVVMVLTAAGFAVALLLNHRRAFQLAERLQADWEPRDVTVEARERHAIRSLSDVQQDVGAIVALAPALFVGLFSTLAQFGGLVDGVVDPISLQAIRTHGALALGVYLVAALGLSLRMVVRLRVALASHSAELARLRNEPDDPYRFHWLERTFLLYATAVLFFGLSVALLCAAGGAGVLALPVGGGAALVSFGYYVVWLHRSRPR